jgi:signal transduction histidine kinase
LHALRLSVDLLLGNTLNSSQRETCLEICDKEINRLSGVTGTMLDFARPERFGRELIVVDHLVVEVLILVDKLVREASLRVSIDLPRDLPPIQSAPDLIAQVLINVIINAIESTPNGGWIHIAADHDQDFVRLMLTNKGSLISQETLQQIFDPFFTTKPQGVGLGLSISRNILRDLHGDLTAENLRSGEGVTFTLKLPIHDVAKANQGGTGSTVS